MKKSLLFTIIMACAGIFLTSGVIIAAKIPETIVIDGQTYKKNKMGPVDFNHKKHFKDYKVKCTECHHEYAEGKNVWKANKPVKKCEECHAPEKSPENPEKLKLMDAFHNNCRECHKTKVAEGIKAPSEKCTNCHQKKK